MIADLGLGLVLIGGGAWGYTKGFFHILVYFVAVVATYFAGMHLFAFLFGGFNRVFKRPVAHALVYVTLFIGIALICFVFWALIQKKVLKKKGVRNTNTFLGVLTGVALGWVVASALLLTVRVHGSEKMKQAVARSYSAPILYQTIRVYSVLLPEAYRRAVIHEKQSRPGD